MSIQVTAMLRLYMLARQFTNKAVEHAGVIEEQSAIHAA